MCGEVVKVASAMRRKGSRSAGARPPGEAGHQVFGVVFGIGIRHCARLRWWAIAAGIDVLIIQLQTARVSPARAFSFGGSVG
jgi:hypothetical protein